MFAQAKSVQTEQDGENTLPVSATVKKESGLSPKIRPAPIITKIQERQFSEPRGVDIITHDGNVGIVDTSYVEGLPEPDRARREFESRRLQARVGSLNTYILIRQEMVSSWARSASQGDSEAQRLLGNAYLRGWGTKKDTDKGLRLLAEAAAQGDKKAALELQKHQN